MVGISNCSNILQCSKSNIWHATCTNTIYTFCPHWRFNGHIFKIFNAHERKRFSIQTWKHSLPYIHNSWAFKSSQVLQNVALSRPHTLYLVHDAMLLCFSARLLIYTSSEEKHVCIGQDEHCVWVMCCCLLQLIRCLFTSLVHLGLLHHIYMIGAPLQVCCVLRCHWNGSFAEDSYFVW